MDSYAHILNKNFCTECGLGKTEILFYIYIIYLIKFGIDWCPNPVQKFFVKNWGTSLSQILFYIYIIYLIKFGIDWSPISVQKFFVKK